jgi:NADH-quinone oxidoreductase subunit L
MMVDVVWRALLFPLLGFVWCVCFGRLWPRLSGRIASIMVGLSFVVAVIVYFGLAALAPDDRIRVGELYTWIGSGAFTIPVGIYLDPLSTTMLLVVTGVSFLIHVYATGYMAGDPGIGRFFAYLNLFVFSMILLILAGNFVLLMVGWAGVGLCSYLLIAFYSDRPEAAAAGVKAFVVNAIGDVGLILAASLILLTFKAADYVTVFNGAKQTVDQGGAAVITSITLLLLVAAIAKSAQLPLYMWLPDAMAGPTPVSALIHAATMVTAGVYLIARAAPLYDLAPFTMGLVAWIGAVTALFAATIGLVKPNIKRVLAYSTVSQLGYMFLAVGVGGYAAGIFHLATHAFFKALLFLGAGAVIHALGGEEDMNRMGGLARRLPLTYVTFLIGGLAISGFPGLSGFFSKDEIISLAFNAPGGNPALGLIALVTAGLTSVYIFRLIFLTFHGTSRVDPQLADHLHQPGPAMAVPLVILAVFAAIAGYVQFPGERFSAFLQPGFTFYGVTAATEAGINVRIALVSSILAIGGILLAWLIWGGSRQTAENLSRSFGSVGRVLQNDYGVNALIDAAIVDPVRGLGRFCSDVLDRAIIDGIVNAVPSAIGGASMWLGRIESGYVRTYAASILFGTILIVLFMIVRGGR